MRRRNQWFHAATQVWGASIDAMMVIALRTARIARGGETGAAEARLMVQEKIDAGMELQAKALQGKLGTSPESILAKTVAHYRPKLRANRRRLTKP